MDIAQAASQLINFIGNNQDLAAQFVAHPYSTTAQAIESDAEISKQDMGQILTQVAAQSAGATVSESETADLANSLLGQSGNSVHSLASALFGGAAGSQSAAQTPDIAGMFTSFMNHEPAKTPAEVLARTAAGAAGSRVLAGLVTSALGLGAKKQ